MGDDACTLAEEVLRGGSVMNNRQLDTESSRYWSETKEMAAGIYEMWGSSTGQHSPRDPLALLRPIPRAGGGGIRPARGALPFMFSDAGLVSERRAKVVRWRDLKRQRSPALIRGVLGRNAMSLLVGPSNVGKSMLAIDLAA